MKKIPKILFLITGLITLLSTTLPASVAQSDSMKTEVMKSPNFPRLGAFINIWLETSVDNTEPAVAYNTNHGEYLVVWTNTRAAGATKDIYARRVRSDGTLLSNFTISHNANFHNYEPDVAYSPLHDEYLVVWTYDSAITDSDIWARRVAWNGSWMSSEFAVGRKTAKQHHPAVTYNPMSDEYLVVYQNSWAGSSDIDAQRIHASDGSSPGWVNVMAGPGFRSYPDVTHCPTSNLYLIAYTFRSSFSGSGDIFGRVASWNFGDMSPEIHICDDVNDQGTVAVAASSAEFLTVWEDAPSSTTTELYARRLSDDGTPLGPSGGFWITGQPGRHDNAPAVAYGSGYGYLIAWHRFAGGLDYNVYGRYAMPGRDYGTGPEFTLDNDVQTQTFPAVACTPIGDCLMVEEDSNSAGGDFEIRGRLAWPYHVFLPFVMKH